MGFMLPEAHTTACGSLTVSADALRVTLDGHIRRFRNVRFNFYCSPVMGKNTIFKIVFLFSKYKIVFYFVFLNTFFNVFYFVFSKYF